MTTDIISLYDFTGEALRPWAEAGHTCYAYDIQHPAAEEWQMEWFPSGGSIHYIHADLHKPETFAELLRDHGDDGGLTTLGMAFPVCTDMAVSGAAHYKRKAEIDPDFQNKAANYAIMCADFFEALGCAYFIENPVSVLASKWRKPDHYFHPYEYGGYIPYSKAEHPRWPEYIAPFDAYPKKTCLWTGGGFVMPEKVSVEVEKGYSTQHRKLGGKSQRTKDIRSATPRGFAIAVCQANRCEPIDGLEFVHCAIQEAMNGNMDELMPALEVLELMREPIA